MRTARQKTPLAIAQAATIALSGFGVDTVLSFSLCNLSVRSIFQYSNRFGSPFPPLGFTPRFDKPHTTQFAPFDGDESYLPLSPPSKTSCLPAPPVGPKGRLMRHPISCSPGSPSVLADTSDFSWRNEARLQKPRGGFLRVPAKQIEFDPVQESIVWVVFQKFKNRTAFW